MGRTLDLRGLAAIYAGGALGALARVGLFEASPPEPGAWPWATFAANMAGALLIGLFVAYLRRRPGEGLAHPFLVTGVCGSLTTFSTLQLELFELIGEDRLGLAVAYVGATLALGYGFLRAGMVVERTVWRVSRAYDG